MGRRRPSHQRREEGNNNPAAAGENPNNNNNNHPLLDSLLQRLRSMAQQAGFAEDLIEIPNAQLLLEATAGDVPLAASLYWDDVLARTEQQQREQIQQQQIQQQQQMQQQQIQQEAVQAELQAQAQMMQQQQQQQQQAAANQNNVAVAAAAALAIVAGQQQAQQAQQQQQLEFGQRRSVLERLPDNHPRRQQQQQQPRPQQAVDEEEGPSDMDEDDPDFQPAAAAAAGGVADSDSSEESEHENDDDDDDSEQGDPPQPRLVVAAGGEEAGVSVSDDDAAAVRRHNRMPRGSTSSKKRTLEEAADERNSASASSLPHSQAPNQPQRQTLQSVHLDETEGFLSENDWIWESVLAPKRDKIPPVKPMDFLWGTEVSPKSHNDPETNPEVDASPSSSTQRKKKKGDKTSSPGHPPDGQPENQDAEKVDEGESPPLVPVTWMRGGLGPPQRDNKCGLSCSAPNEDDIGYLLWKQQMPKSVNQKNLKLEPPYHCQSVTLLPAIVTALMQAGVTVVQERRPSPHVTCQTTQTPYFQLDPKDQARQYESRLVDALTSLLVIAAQASKQRKAKALERMEKEQKEMQSKQERFDDSDDDAPIKREKPVKQDVEDMKNMTSADMVMNRVKRNNVKQEAGGSGKHHNKKQSKKSAESTSRPKKHSDMNDNDWDSKWQKLKSKINLCPTCWWEKESNNSNNNNANPPQNNGNVLPDPEGAFTIPVSYTHICDLRAYVKSNLGAFTSTGGCFLFLETILQIHGKDAVQRMVQASREKESTQCRTSSKIIPPLIRCQCQERYQRKQQEHRMNAWPAPKTAKKPNEGNDKSTEDESCNDCASVELVSLLLTGRVYSNWKGWSTSMTPYANLGVGLFMDQPGQVGRGLTRPLKPIWIIKGPSQYSVMWLNERNSAGVLNAPGFVANMTHWSCWYGSSHHSKTDFRFMAGKEDIHTMHKQLEFTESEEDKKKKWMMEIGTESSPSKSNTSDKENSSFSRTLTLLNKRRELQMSADTNLKVTESVDTSLLFSKADLDRVRVHPDDGKFYENYRLWRYDIVEDEETRELQDAQEDVKPRGDHWTPFHRLSKVNQYLVETKLGPKLLVVLRTRWPGAKIDRMEPASPLPLV